MIPLHMIFEICLFAHANLAKSIFMALLRQTVFILTNEHNWEKKLWYFDVKHLHQSPRAEKDPRCTRFYRISDVIFWNDACKIRCLIQTWEFKLDLLTFFTETRFRPICQELNGFLWNSFSFVYFPAVSSS